MLCIGVVQQDVRFDVVEARMYGLNPQICVVFPPLRGEPKVPEGERSVAARLAKKGSVAMLQLDMIVKN